MPKTKSALDNSSYMYETGSQWEYTFSRTKSKCEEKTVYVEVDEMTDDVVIPGDQINVR